MRKQPTSGVSGGLSSPSLSSMRFPRMCVLIRRSVSVSCEQVDCHVRDAHWEGKRGNSIRSIVYTWDKLGKKTCWTLRFPLSLFEYEHVRT